MHWIGYTLWLIWQVVSSAFFVAVDTLRIDNTQKPIIVNYPLRITGEWERTFFSTSITMTPGTLSVGFRPVEEVPGAESESGLILLVQAVYGSDPAGVIADLAHMEEKLAPRLKGQPVEYAEWMLAGGYAEGYRRDVDTPLDDMDEERDNQVEQERMAAVKKARVRANGKRKGAQR